MKIPRGSYGHQSSNVNRNRSSWAYAKRGFRSHIMFVSQKRSPAVVRAAFTLGPRTYVLRSDVCELLNAIDVTLRGGRFTRPGVSGAHA